MRKENILDDWYAIMDFRDKEELAWIRREVARIKKERKQLS